MANPSTVWAQLSLPYSPVGSVPYVTTDGQSILTDVLHFKYLDNKNTTLSTGQLWYQMFLWNGIQVKYADTTAAPGTTATINQVAGRFKLPAGASSAVITNNCCYATSIVHVTIETNDATLKYVTYVTPAAGSFTMNFNAASTGQVTVSFTITNVSP